MWPLVNRVRGYLGTKPIDAPAKEKAKAIRQKVGIVEKLHKTCQLSKLGLAEPILNESRYLARALADLIYYDEGSSKHSDALHTADHAANCAINDAIDILITYVKVTLAKIAKQYPNFQIATSSFGDDYLEVLRAIQELDARVVYSRETREERYEIYKGFSDDPEQLACVAKFALKLLEIEAIAQRTLGVKNGDSPSERDLIERLHTALREPRTDETLRLNFQAKYRRSGSKGDVCIGAEALLRFSIGGIPYSTPLIIEIAELGRILPQIGSWVMQEALSVLKSNPQIPHISVNVSSVELLSPDFALTALARIQDAGVDPKRLELEITEGTAINDSESERHLAKLAEAGVRIAIDDFGTGETRFDYLAKIPLKVIKIDMSLVRKFEEHPDRYGKLLKAIAAVGKSGDLEVIAEGVEEESTVVALHNIGIELFQGYRFSKPAPLSQFLADHFPST